jgi:hypothetical protein
LVWPSVEDTHPRMMLLIPKVKPTNKKMPTIRAGIFSVATASTKPTMTMHLQVVICHVRSLKCPELCAIATAMIAAKR